MDAADLGLVRSASVQSDVGKMAQMASARQGRDMNAKEMALAWMKLMKAVDATHEAPVLQAVVTRDDVQAIVMHAPSHDGKQVCIEKCPAFKAISASLKCQLVVL
jgi:hypothetical protein